MSFTYDFNTAPELSSVRLLIADTNSADPVFTDDEVNQALFLESSQNLFISGQAAPTGAQSQVPVVPQVYSIYRAAALLLDARASNASAAGSVVQILDVKLDASKAAETFRSQAKCYRETEATRGQFAIAEMVRNPFQARERVYNQWLRLFQ